MYPDGIVSVTDFLSPAQLEQVRAGGLIDCTEAFARAQLTATVIRIPPGRYGLANLRLHNGITLVGAATNAVRIDQLSAALPAIACVSDEASGQLSGVIVEKITVYGHPSATVAAVLIAAYKQYAVWRSRIEIVAHNTFRALEVQGADAANVFYCQFEVISEGTRDIAILVNGGTYNSIRAFVTKCRSWAIDDSSANAEIRAIGENCMIFRGQNNKIFATLEEIPFNPASDVGVEDKGFGNTFDNPTVIMSTDGKLIYGFKPFSNSVFINPQIIGKKGAVKYPFALGIGEQFTIIGGRSQSSGYIEDVYDNSSDKAAEKMVIIIGGSTGLTRKNN
jgi:hypothetical protein